MRILVCGDRHWTDYQLILATLLGIGAAPHLIIDGEAKGADSMGNLAAMRLNWKYERYPADWNRYGKAAGPIRNQQMLNAKPDLVLAFHDDLTKSKGTANMVKIAKAKGVPVRVIGHQ
jgi:SLOG family YspA-like protein